MSEPISVGVAELRTSTNSDVLASFGLGSCVAVAMFDPLKGIGGLAHVMLPESHGKDSEESPGKFADTAVQRLLEWLVDMGARRRNLKCKIVGGAQMFELPGSARRPKVPGAAEGKHIGARNVDSVKRALEEIGIPLVAEDTGGNYGRTVRFDSSSGEVEISSIGYEKKVI